MSIRTVTVLTALSLVVTGCGKKGALYYPDQLVAKPPQPVVVEQSEAALRLTATLSDTDLSGHKLKDLEALLISRRVCRDADCTACSEPFHELKRIVTKGGTVSWIDTDVRTGERIQYRLQTEQAGGVRGMPVTSLPMSVVAVPAVPEIVVKSVFGGSMVITAKGLVPEGATSLGFLVYRATGVDGQLQLIGRYQPDVLKYDDQTVAYGVEYRYAVRHVIKLKDGMVIESPLSTVVQTRVAEDPQ